MPEVDEVVLQEYVATANNSQYNGDWEIINSKFPELKNVDKQLLKEYVATANNPDYNMDWKTINSKFPEFKEEFKEEIETPEVEETVSSTIELTPERYAQLVDIWDKGNSETITDEEKRAFIEIDRATNNREIEDIWSGEDPEHESFIASEMENELDKKDTLERVKKARTNNLMSNYFNQEPATEQERLMIRDSKVPINELKKITLKYLEKNLTKVKKKYFLGTLI